MRIHISR